MCVVADFQFRVPFRGHLEWNDDAIGEGWGLVRGELFEKCGEMADCGRETVQNTRPVEQTLFTHSESSDVGY